MNNPKTVLTTNSCEDLVELFHDQWFDLEHIPQISKNGNIDFLFHETNYDPFSFGIRWIVRVGCVKHIEIKDDARIGEADIEDVRFFPKAGRVEFVSMVPVKIQMAVSALSLSVLKWQFVSTVDLSRLDRECKLLSANTDVKYRVHRCSDGDMIEFVQRRSLFKSRHFGCITSPSTATLFSYETCRFHQDKRFHRCERTTTDAFSIDSFIEFVKSQIA